MVLSHSIQCGSGNAFYTEGLIFNNILYKYIVSINMPLFMLVSGYLFYFSVQRHSFTENVKRKIASLFVPILIWNVLISLIDLFRSELSKDPWTWFKLYCNEVLGQLWFLWAVLICSIIVALVNRFLRDNIGVYILIFISTFFIPDILNLNLYKFMYVFFVIGYFFNKYKGLNLLRLKKFPLIIIAITVLYIIMMFFYKKDFIIYVTGCNILNKSNMLYQVYINFYRIVVALLGCSVVIYLIYLLSKYIRGVSEKILLFIGKNTMGIYIISYLIDVYMLTQITFGLSGYNFLLAIIETIVVIIVTLFLIMLIKKIKVLNMLLFGGRE